MGNCLLWAISLKLPKYVDLMLGLFLSTKKVLHDLVGLLFAQILQQTHPVTLSVTAEKLLEASIQSFANCASETVKAKSFLLSKIVLLSLKRQSFYSF
jgi:hypothetical protein